MCTLDQPNLPEVRWSETSEQAYKVIKRIHILKSSVCVCVCRKRQQRKCRYLPYHAHLKNAPPSSPLFPVTETVAHKSCNDARTHPANTVMARRVLLIFWCPSLTSCSTKRSTFSTDRTHSSDLCRHPQFLESSPVLAPVGSRSFPAIQTVTYSIQLPENQTSRLLTGRVADNTITIHFTTRSTLAVGYLTFTDIHRAKRK